MKRKNIILSFILISIFSFGTMRSTNAFIRPPLVINGYVYDFATSTPINDAQVDLYVYDFISGWDHKGTVDTEPDGSYSFTNVPIGAIKLIISKSGYHSYEGAYQQYIYLNPYTYDYTFYGQIFDLISGQALKDATVKVTYGTTTKTQITDNSGCYSIKFSFSTNAYRTFTRQVSKPNYKTQSDQISMYCGYEHQHIYLNYEIVAGIIVDSGLWSKTDLQTAVLQYEQDLKDQGIGTLIHYNAISNVQSMKSILQSWYTNYELSGATLIGDLPYAQFYHPVNGDFDEDTFICELFLMDLDGTWSDTNSDDVYDQHTAVVGTDIEPEIFIGRIDASTKWDLITNKDDIIMLLNRIHSYRNGGVSRTHRAITYIDDPWSSTGWHTWVDNAYPNNVDVINNAITTAEDWKNRLDDDYEWAHLCAHSCPNYHSFERPGGADKVYASDIRSIGPSINFYNLFACSAADWEDINCLAISYLFSGSHSLLVVGSTKSGGMKRHGDKFYNALSFGHTIGYGFKNWYPWVLGSTNYLEWYYGMCILGDPFLTIY